MVCFVSLLIHQLFNFSGAQVFKNLNESLTNLILWKKPTYFKIKHLHLFRKLS